MAVKVKLEFKLLSTRKVAGGHLLTLNLRNRGNNILKSLVVRLHSADSGLSVDYARCFVYALMPGADEKVKFQVSFPSLVRAYFSVSGYSSGDAYFSMESLTVNIQARKPMENSMLVM